MGILRAHPNILSSCLFYNTPVISCCAAAQQQGSNLNKGMSPRSLVSVIAVISIIPFVTILFIFLLSLPAAAGPFGYGGGYEYYPGISKDDPAFSGWATDWKGYNIGTHVDPDFQKPEKALGKATGNAFDVVSLGRGGSIIICFNPPVRNGAGWDFAVFENSFNDRFLELAYVEVSSDGVTFIRFPSCSLTPRPVNGFGTIDNTDIIGLAGKYRQGYGTAFDLQELSVSNEVLTGVIDLSRISYIRIIDCVGDGSCYDNRSKQLKTVWGEDSPIYDPYPTAGSAGFDLEAVGARFQSTGYEVFERPPYPPLISSPGNGAQVTSLMPSLTTDPFSDPDPQDIHMCSQWQISRSTDFSHPLFSLTSSSHLTSLTLYTPVLDYDERYYWRVRFYDTSAEVSQWSAASLFITTASNEDNNSNGIPDNQELDPNNQAHIDLDIDRDGIPDVQEMDGAFKCLNMINGTGIIGMEVQSKHTEILFLESTDPNRIPYASSRPHNAPYGFFSFRLKVENPGDIASVALYISAAAENGITGLKWYTYDLSNEWQEIYPYDPNHQQRQTYKEEPNLFRFSIQDGGPFDADFLSNGVIVSQGGPGIFSPVVPPPDGGSGLGGLSGCFIDTLSTVLKNLSK